MFKEKQGSHTRKGCDQTDANGGTCKKFHYKLLNANNISERSPAHVNFAQDTDCATILPMVTGLIEGKDSFKSEANIFLDSEAQVCMIRNAYAELLGLKGKPINIVITKVGGVEEKLITKLYKVLVYSSDGSKIQVIHAVGIAQISEGYSDGNLDEISRTFDISFSMLNGNAGAVDLLIGINYPQFHAGETKMKKSLTVRRSPLGWVAFSAGTGEIVTENKQVLPVCLASPIDLTDFWKTESTRVMSPSCECSQVNMSLEEEHELKLISESCKLVSKQWTVSYPWKGDPEQLPDNHAQVLKKLEYTESRLIKLPEHAKAYNDQMEEKGFSQKLTKQEIAEWKKPVHYLSHHAILCPEKKSTPVHIIFNSSATFEGHCLNDYWHKGPDLFNNLFEVILQFQENAIAVCTNIERMYHTVAIPLINQHVH